MSNLPTKTTFLPISGLVDISQVLPLIDHPQFQRLRHIKQLALIHLEHAGGVHTRFEHSLGVYALTQRMVERLPFSLALKKALPVFGLLHDVGHGAFSHTLETLLIGEHKKNTLDIIKSLKPEIERSGADFSLVLKLAEHRQPEHVVVSDKNIGADKLDYLERDAFHLGWPTTLPKDTIIHHLVWLAKKKTLAVEEKAIEQVITIQNRYVEQYLEIYLRKVSLITTRMLQRAVVEHNVQRGLANATDQELFAALLTSPSPITRALAHQLLNRQLYKAVVTLKLPGCERAERTAGKALKSLALPQKKLLRLVALANDQQRLLALEQQLAAKLDLPSSHLLIAAPNYWEKSLPADCAIYSVTSQKTNSLFTLRPGHARALTERSREALSVHVCVPANKRKVIYKKISRLMAELTHNL